MDSTLWKRCSKCKTDNPEAIRFLLQRKRSVELVTNGLLLSDSRLIEIIPRINKLHVSLDVTNDEDYKNFKLPTDKGGRWLFNCSREYNENQ